MEFFFKKDAGCHLTKKELHHSFFWMYFVKVFRSEIKLFSSFCSFTSVLTQNSIMKNLFPKSVENNYHGILFLVKLQVLRQLKKGLQKALKRLYEILLMLWKMSFQVKYLEVNFETWTCAALPQQQVFD